MFRLIQDELPNLIGSRNIFMDLETTGLKDPELVGVAITVDDNPDCYYIPVKHKETPLYHNVSKEKVVQWIKDIFSKAECWINHNIKYDAHVLWDNCRITNFPRIEDTLTQIKIIDSDQFNYNLTFCAKNYLYTDISPFEERLKREVGRKDYSYAPIDTMRDYACTDVEITRRLYRYCSDNIPYECKFIWDLENNLTRVLFDIENVGLPLNLEKLERDNENIPKIINVFSAKLGSLIGQSSFSPSKNSDMYKLICNTLGLPVIAFSETGKPSFNEEALTAYIANYPQHKNVLEFVKGFKELWKLYTSFTVPYYNLNKNGRLHSDYNQLVRTGRMSVRSPNAQQLSPKAKEYIVPSRN